MSQAAIWGAPLNGPVNPVAYSERIDENLDALLSSHSGSARPAYAVAGTEWVSTATAGKLKVYRYDGANDHLVLTIDVASGAVTYSNGAVDDMLSLYLPLAGGKLSGALDLSGNSLKNVGAGIPNYVKGLITSKTAAFTISVGAGELKGNARLVTNAGAFTKLLSAVWAAGSGSGGRDHAGAVAANTTYHIHALSKDSDGSFDWLYSLSATAPIVPSGYTWVGRLWSVYTNNANTAIWDYLQLGNECYISYSTHFVQSSTLASQVVTVPAAIPCPSGVRVAMHASLVLQIFNAGATATAYYYDADDVTQLDLSGIALGVAAGQGSVRGKVKTNLARGIGIAFSGSSIAIGYYLGGWEDFTLNRIN